MVFFNTLYYINKSVWIFLISERKFEKWFKILKIYYKTCWKVKTNFAKLPSPLIYYLETKVSNGKIKENWDLKNASEIWNIRVWN